MKTVTFRLPEALIAEINTEARNRGASRSDVVRERLATWAVRPPAPLAPASFGDLAGDLIGSVAGDGLPSDLSGQKKHYLKAMGYGQKRDRR
jgi:hypothetical protein